MVSEKKQIAYCKNTGEIIAMDLPGGFVLECSDAAGLLPQEETKRRAIGAGLYRVDLAKLVLVRTEGHDE